MHVWSYRVKMGKYLPQPIGATIRTYSVKLLRAGVSLVRALGLILLGVASVPLLLGLLIGACIVIVSIMADDWLDRGP